MSPFSRIALHALACIVLLGSITLPHTTFAIPDDGNRGYSQGSYGRADRDQQGGGYSQSSYNTGNNPGNNNAPGYNPPASPSPTTPRGSIASGNDDDDDDSSYNTPSFVRSVASIIWSAGAKTAETAQRVFAAATAVVTKSTQKNTYTALPNGQYLSSNGDVTPTRTPIDRTTTGPVGTTPVSVSVPPQVQAQIDAAIEEQHRATGIVTLALTSLQKAQLAAAAKPLEQGGLGLNIDNPAAVATFLSAVRFTTSVDMAIDVTKRALGTRGATINGASVQIAFGRSCGDADCQAAENLRALAGFGGVGGTAQAQEDLEKQMQGIHARIQRERESANEVNPIIAENNRISYENGTASYDATIAQQREKVQMKTQREAEARAEATYTEYALTRSVSDSVPMGDAYYALRDAEAELARAKNTSIGAAADSEQMLAYKEAQRRYGQAVISYQGALLQIDDGQEEGATLLATQAIADAQGSAIVSELLTEPINSRPLDRNPGSGYVSIFDQPSIVDVRGPDTVRNLDVDPELLSTIQEEVRKICGSSCTIEITSGGQHSEGTGSAHVGSIRHDCTPNCEAVDIRVRGATGDLWTNVQLADLGQNWLAGDNGSVGVYANSETMIHLDLHGGEEGRPLFSFEGIFWDNTSNSDIQRRLNLGRDGTISSRTVTQGVGVNGIFMDFDRYVEEGLNPEPENTELSSPSTAATRTERVITAVLNLATNPVGTIVGFIGNLFGGGTGGSSNPTPYVKDDDRDNPTKPIPPEPIPSTDLFTTATGATETGRETATSTEYKFAGSITRVIFEAEDGIPVTDINANYADTITTSLSIDYQCDTTVNATSSSRLAYTAFDPIEDTSTVLLSSYVPLTEFGTHCFFITVDTKNKVMEKDEENNTSNVYRFIVDNPI